MLRSGDVDQAHRMLAEAAKLEERAFEAIPAGRQRTRGIVAVSAVSIRAAVGDSAGVVALAARYLHQGDLLDEHQTQLVELIVEAERRTQSMERGGVGLSQMFDVALRGADVGVGGLIPLETVVLKLQQFRNYFVRVGEYASKTPFRTRGTESDLTSFTPMIAPARAGSYRFQIGLDAPAQQLLISGGPYADPQRVADEAFRILEVASEHPESITDRVHDAAYADWFTKAVRNIAPSGKGLTEVQVSRSDTHASATLGHDSRVRLDRHIRNARRTGRTTPVASEEVESQGTLRALHLNEGWLLIVDQEGQQKRFEIGQAIWDDVVGPLVNHRVRVIARKKGSHTEAVDIVEADD